MPERETTDRHFQIDWLISNLRWLLLLLVALVVFLDVIVAHRSILRVDRLLPQILLLITAILYNLAVVLFLSRNPASRILPLLTVVLDTLLTIGLILSSGGLSSPLLFFALFPILTAVIRFSQPMGMFMALPVITSFGLSVYLTSPPTSWPETLSFVTFSLVMLLAAIVSSFVSEQVKIIAAQSQYKEVEIERRKLRAARERSRLTFELASTLSATLNYKKVLKAVLEVGEKGLQELGQDRASQVGAVLLFGHRDLRIAASRHLSSPERSIAFQGKEGALADALTIAEPVVVEDPIRDPELSKLTSMQSCKQAIVVPLRAGFESFGVVIFGSSQPDVYTEDLVSLLTAICNQAIVALQNAQLYQDLLDEKERIVAVEEDARKKLARSLHDGPTQSIASIAMQVSFVQKLIEHDRSSAQIAEELRKIEDLARRTTKQIRHMLFTLRPLILETQGLRAALDEYISKLAETGEIPIHFHAEPAVEETLDQETQGIIFYIVEEAISNARKHSQADEIWVRLYLQDEQEFVAEVEDNGVGFDVDAVQMTYDRRGSLGLINMHERAEMTGGELLIASGPGKGTQVRLTVPLTEGPSG
jgi:signal transduction histidine kinase